MADLFLQPVSQRMQLMRRVVRRLARSAPATLEEEMKPAALMAVIFLAVVALVHIIRLLLRVELIVGGALIPVWVSLFAVLGPGGLAIWLWREQRASG